MTVQLEQLKRPPANISPAAFYDEVVELGLFPSYKRHLQIARLLGSEPHGLYRDCWLSLLASIECFLKDVYCIVRFKLWDGKSPTACVYKEFYKRPKVAEAIIAKSFGHDLIGLAMHLQTVYPDLNSDWYKELVRNLPRSNWVEDRYNDPIDSNYKVKFETLLTSFTSLLDNSFGEWK